MKIRIRRLASIPLPLGVRRQQRLDSEHQTERQDLPRIEWKPSYSHRACIESLPVNRRDQLGASRMRLEEESMQAQTASSDVDVPQAALKPNTISPLPLSH